MLKKNGVGIGTKQMWRWWLFGAALSFLTGTASAQSSGSYVNADNSVLLPPAVAFAQANTQIATLEPRNSFGTAYGYDLGNGFKTEIQGVTARAANGPLTNLPTRGSDIAATSVMLYVMYEFSCGAWHISSYFGGRLGILFCDSLIPGAQRNTAFTSQ